MLKARHCQMRIPVCRPLEQMYCIEESTCDVVGTCPVIQRPRHCSVLVPRRHAPDLAQLLRKRRVDNVPLQETHTTDKSALPHL